jgi:uncharacterized membrane protein required for colicin V production
MLWDGLIVVLIVTLALAGWNVGIINSWRGPVAMLIATIATQQFYVDFCTWIVQQLRVPPEQAIGIGYVLLWLAIEIVIELLMSVLLPFGSKNKPVFFERAAGATLGVIRALVIILLPMIALHGPIKVPSPPPDKSALVNPMQSGIDKSGLLAFFYNMGKGLYPAARPIVVSEKEPSFKPNFSGSTTLDGMNEGQK